MKIDFYFFINLLTFYNFLIPQILLLILFIIIFRYQIKSLFYNERVELAKNDAIKFFYFYKIKNFYFIWFWILMYFFIFIFLFLSFRIYRMGYTLDLNYIKKTYIIIYNLKQYLFIFLFTLFIIIIFLSILLLLKKIKNFLETYLLQQHLYLINYQTEKKYERFPGFCYSPRRKGFTKEDQKDKKNNYLKNGLYKKIFYYFYFFSYSHLISVLIDLDYKMTSKYFNETRFANSGLIHFSYYFKIMLDIKYNVIIPISILCYELIFCNLTVTYLFYFLPFYFLYTLWYKLSCFWYLNRMVRLDAILYELYYDFPNIMYFNLDQDELNVIFRYILGGLNKMPNPDSDESSLAYRITHYKRYILCENKMYINLNTQDSISREQYEEIQNRNSEGNKIEEEKQNKDEKNNNTNE